MGQYNPREGQTQVQIPFGKKQELDALRAKVQQDMARPVGDPKRITDMQAAQQLQEAATGKSDPLTDLKNMRLDGGEQPRSALRNFSFLDGGQPSQPASGSMQVGLPSGMTSGDTQKRQAYEAQMHARNGGAGSGPGITSPVNIPVEQNNLKWQGGKSPMQQTVGQPGPTFQQQLQDSVRNEGILGREMASRPQAGPSANPVLGALGRAGKGMSGYMKSLFDDPQRMALLQGGLSMMDPNSYYDKQGFGSVFTGLNKGLGAAQQGHAGVQARRKALADRQKTEAEALYTLGGKSGESKAEFERVLTEYQSLPDGSPRKKMLKRRLDTLAPEGGTRGTNYNYKEMATYTWDKLVPKSDEMQTSLTNFTNLMNSTLDSPAGIVFGPGTDFKAHAYAVLSETFGQDMGEEGERLANTRNYMSAMGAQVAAAITAFGAGTGLSDADRKFAEQMTGKNPGDFTEDSLRKLLIYNEGAMRGQLVAHNQRLKDMYGGNPPAGTLRKLPQMSRNLHNHMVEQMKDGNYTVGGEAVDPNKPPPGWKNDYEDQWKLLAKKSAEKSQGQPTKSRITKVNNG